MSNTRPRHWLLLAWLLATTAPLLAAQPLVVSSPNGALRATFELRDGAPHYSLTNNGRELIHASPMGFELADGVSLARGFEIVDHATSEANETWTQPWGQRREVRDHHHELRLRLKQPGPEGLSLSIVFRAFDDGVAFRYEAPLQPAIDEFVITEEKTRFELAGDWSAWWVPALEDNRYEYVYENTPVSELETVHTPLTCKADDNTYVAFHEAALVDFSSMTLQNDGGHTLRAKLVPWSDGVKVRGKGPLRSPWRTIQVASSPAGLADSNLILNLNEPCALDDTSWIRPGKYVGVWWEMHLDTATWGSGERHGATTENTRRYIDFAAENGFDGVLVEGWNKGWDDNWMENGDRFSFTEPYPDFDLEGLARYARERGVTLVGHHETAGGIPNYERQLEDAFALYERLGVKAVKTGYVDFGSNVERRDESGAEQGEWHHGQYMVRHHQRVAEVAAKHHVMVVAHEPIKDTGLRRTWPHLMSREGARGQEYNAWSGEYRNPPSHVTVLPFTRMLSGPMDYTPGVFDIKLTSGNRTGEQIPGTLAKELALYVVIYSPLQMACDLPENYASHPDAFRFIREVAVDWEQSHTLQGVIGDYAVVARKERGGDEWFLGAVTDEQARELQAELSFLEADRAYEAHIYRDADDADWRDNPTAYTVERRRVDAGTTLTLRLAPGGGQAIRFAPLDPQPRTVLNPAD
ncbi:glycoside hydrolase family 97 protein [Pseudobythopirellula maris]|nr:glycoside hydrolase family 97 protein [Pseudobythopirellula maris]